MSLNIKPKNGLYLVVLVMAAILFRYPYLINPTVFNSDHAVVGLQGLEILKGHRSWYLWGVGYQSSLEPLLAAIYYRLFGFSHFALAVVGIGGFLVVIIFTFLSLQRVLEPSRSFVLSCFAIPSAMAITQITVFPPRVWALSFVFLSVFLLGSRSRGSVFWGAFFAFFSLYIDYYVLQLLPGVVVYGYLQTKEDLPTKTSFRWGTVLGAVFLILCRLLRPEGGVPIAFSPRVFLKNVPLLWRDAIPALIGTHSTLYNLVQNSTELAWVARGVAIIVSAFIIYSTFYLVRKKNLTSPAVVGILGTWISLIAFSGSSMASDVHSVRYLGVICWLLPFSLLPVTKRMSQKVFWGVMPILLAAWFLVGWNTYYPLVEHFKPVKTDRGNAVEEMKLIEELRKRGVSIASAGYWTSYRLSLIAFDEPIFVPSEKGLNRYLPYWEKFQAEATKLHIVEKDGKFNYTF